MLASKPGIIRGLLLGAFLMAAIAGRVEARTQYMLLDVSGSMKPHYANNMNGWLFEPLMRSGAFSPDDRVIVRWFDHRGNMNFDTHDRQLTYDGRYDAQTILSHMPHSQDAIGKYTDIPEALELALKDIDQLKVTDEVLIWLVTDNVQDIGNGGTADPLYQRIKDDNDFQSAYIFPLTTENNSKLPPTAEAMVLYLLQFSKKPSRPGLDRIADDVGRKIGNVPVTWFPIDKGIDLNEANIKVNDEPSAMVDGKLRLPDVPEGTNPEFTLQFPFQSRLRNLKIAQSKITPQRSTMSLPSTLNVQGDVNSWRGSITPTDLTIEPGKRSAVTYTTKLTGDMTMGPASFWDALWNSTSDPVDVQFGYKLLDVETRMDLSGISQVRNLQGIESNVRQSQKNIRSATIPMSFQVRFNSLWRRLVAAAACLALIGLVAGGASLFLLKTRYQLSTPSGEQNLSLPLIGRNYIAIQGDRAAVIRRTFGRLSVSPLGSYLINGTLKSQNLPGTVNSFEVENPVDNSHYSYTLSRSPGVPTAVRHDDFLD
ncbi:MAG TPA: hypothetical protein VNG71_11525 [Pyrinomonadaceae bacterium]|nr:hypothetical protein [Pyrinomonadaceae bacterium]